ncbi:hypothetical protein [Campylobacter avium]|uniref:hypothetical protein n=3 Tax=Campylobacter avium TaxID=522485 RepID=UPI00255BF7B7|nr:hypothetical protein [Campylobacter avium]
MNEALQYEYTSDRLKELIKIYINDSTEENLMNVAKEIKKENYLETKKLLDLALIEIKKELEKISDKFVSKDYLDAKLEALEYKINEKISNLKRELKEEIASVKSELKEKIDENTNEIKNIKKDIKYYAFVIIALMIILQPKVIEFISTIFSVSK